MLKFRYRCVSALTLAGIGVGTFVLPALAQDDEDVIIVTATRREQSILDVPLAVSAFSTDELQKTQVDDIQEVMGISPSFQATTNSSETQGTVIRIRGVGTQGNNPAFESAVGVFIDGVYRSRAGAALSELLDVERLEVLRGPQGTLFGRNTTAGALNIVTKGPEFEFGGYGEVTYGNYNDVDVRGSVTGPIVADTLAGRFSALYHRRDGLIEDTFLDDEYDNRDRYTLKGQLLFTPTENFDLRIIGDYRDQNESCCYPVTLGSGVAGDIFNLLGFVSGFPDQVQIDPTDTTPFAVNPFSPTRPGDPFGREASRTVTEPLIQDVQDWGISGEATWRGEGFNIVGIFAHRDFASTRASDIDFTALDVLNLDNREDGIKATTLEMRVQGEWGWLDWLVGGYYIDEQVTLRGTVTHGAAYESFINARLGLLIAGLTSGAAFSYSDLAAIGDPVNCDGANYGTCWADGTGVHGDYFESNNTAYSVFTHNVISFTDSLKLTLGARFNVDEKDAFSELGTTIDPGCEALKVTLDDGVTWTAPIEGSFNLLGIVPGDTRRAVDVILALGCLGITSPGYEFDTNKDDDEWSGTANLSYQFEDGTLLFASYSRGFKAGGINLDRAGTILTATGVTSDLARTPGVNEGTANFLDPRFKAELVDAYEAGMKQSLWGGKLNYNTTFFLMQIDDFQLNTFTGFNFVPENVDAATTMGVEFEVMTRPIDGLNIRSGVTWAQTDYDDGITDLTNILTNERNLRFPNALGAPGNFDLLPEISSLAGRQLTNAPKWVVTTSITYTHPVPNTNMQGWIHTDFRIDSGYNTGSDLDPIKEQDGYTVVNAQIGLGHVDGTWEFTLWARNLLDKNYQQIAFDIPLQSNDGWGTFLADPRMYGGTLRARF